MFSFHFYNKFSTVTVIHTVKSFDIVNKVEVDVFLELSCFFSGDPMDVVSLCISPLFQLPSHPSLVLKSQGKKEPNF